MRNERAVEKPVPDASDERVEVLIADDEEGICFSLRRALANKGFIVHVAAEGRSAVAMVHTRIGRIRAAFVDVLMPRIGGPSVVDAIRSLDPSVRCCLMTAHRHNPDRSPLIARPDLPILDKPFSLSDFTAKLEQLLSPTISRSTAATSCDEVTVFSTPNGGISK